MGNRKEDLGKGMEDKDIAVRHIGMDSNGVTEIWG